MTDQYTAMLREIIDQGRDIDSALGELRHNGATPIDCIKAIREVHGVNLGEAKRIFAESSAWSDLRESHDAFIDELLKGMDDAE